MSWVTDAFLETWRSGRHLGAAAPRIVVEVRRGSFRRAYRDWDDPIRASIPGETRDKPWYPIFTETTAWVEIPNIRTVQQVNGFDSNGCKVATIDFDNVGYVQQTGPGGDAYRTIERGYYSPDRGYVPPTRPASGLPTNDWANVLTKNANIRVWQGLGEPERVDGAMPDDGGSNGTWTFNGLVDDVDLDATPVTGQIVVRMGKTLTDARVFGWNKSKQLPDPIIFVDRNSIDQITNEGYKPLASSFRGDSYHSYNVLDGDAADTDWISDASVTPDFTQWVQIRLPAGRYSDFVLHCPAGMELYVGIKPTSQVEVDPDTGGTFAAPPTRDGTDITAGAFYDAGLGTVPGDNGGWEYVQLETTVSGKHTIDLDAEYEVGKGTILRLGFRDLAADPLTGGVYSGQVHTFHARRRDEHRTKESRLWIGVDDISDMVRTVCRWAGYQEWEIEDTGVSLKGKYIVNRANFLIDPIKRACDLTGFVFFIADPSNGSSIGVPTFRRPAALIRDPAIIAAEFADTDMIGQLQVKASEESLPYIIRVRGKEASASAGGIGLGGDKVRRIMFVYRPPWTEDNEMAGIIKHVVKYDPALRTDDEVKMGCYLIAAAAALAAYTGQLVVPGLPLLELDDQVGVMDTATGTNSRLWISSLSDTFTRSKDETSWRTTVGGNLLDSQDLVDVIAAILSADFGDAGTPVVISSERQPRTR